MSMLIRSSACLGSFGTSAEDLPRGLEAPIRAARADGRAAAADLSLVKNCLPPRSLRQVDHFTKMSVLCAFQALEAAGIEPGGENGGKQGRFGIILASGYGPASPTFDFLDSILRHGELMSSPLAFSRSVHNIPAATLSMLLGWSGPCATVCQPDCPVSAALLLAEDWLREQRVDMVLFGAADETTPLLASVSRRLAARNAGRLPDAGDAAIAAEAEKFREASDAPDAVATAAPRRLLPLGEGAAFFCLEGASSPVSGPCITRIEMRPRPAPGEGRFPHEDFSLPPSLPVFVSGRVPSRLSGGTSLRRAEGAYGNLPVAQAMDMVLASRTLETVGEQGCLAYGGRFSGYVHMKMEPAKDRRV